MVCDQGWPTGGGLLGDATSRLDYPVGCVVGIFQQFLPLGIGKGLTDPGKHLLTDSVLAEVTQRLKNHRTGAATSWQIARGNVSQVDLYLAHAQTARSTICEIYWLCRYLGGQSKAIGGHGTGRNDTAAGSSANGVGNVIDIAGNGNAQRWVGLRDVVQPAA